MLAANRRRVRSAPRAREITYHPCVAPAAVDKPSRDLACGLDNQQAAESLQELEHGLEYLKAPSQPPSMTTSSTPSCPKNHSCHVLGLFRFSTCERVLTPTAPHPHQPKTDPAPI